MFFGACGGVIWSALLITSKPQVFRSLAKLVAGGRTVGGEDLTAQEQRQDFYGTITETLESAEVYRKARERVNSLHPDLKNSDVEIRVVRAKGSAIFNILATGSEPKYTQIFLNALLDEFIAIRVSIREQAQGKVLQSVLQEVVNKQKEMEQAGDHMEAARRDAKTILGRMELERLKARLTALSNERDDLNMELKGNPPEAEEKTARHRLLEDEIERIRGEITEAEAAIAKLNVASERYSTAKQVYQKMFERAETFQNVFNISSEYVAVQERATTASEHTEAWKMPVILGGLGGAAAGAVTGLLLSLFFTLRGQPSAPKA